VWAIPGCWQRCSQQQPPASFLPNSPQPSNSRHSNRPRHRNPLRQHLTVHKPFPGPACPRTNRSFSENSATTGVRCHRSASRRWRAAVPAGSACRLESAGRRNSDSNAGARYHRISAVRCATVGRDFSPYRPTNKVRFARISAGFNSCHPSGARCYASNGETPRPPNVSR